MQKISLGLAVGTAITAAAFGVQPAEAGTIIQQYSYENSGVAGFDGSLGKLTSVTITNLVLSESSFAFSPPPKPGPYESVELFGRTQATFRIDLDGTAPLYFGSTVDTFVPIGDHSSIETPFSHSFTTSGENTVQIDLLSSNPFLIAQSQAKLDAFTTPDYINIFQHNLIISGAIYVEFADKSGNYFYGDPTSTYSSYFGTVTYEYAPLAAGVPEPSTWAVLLLGFGVLGGAMRKRRTRPEVAFIA